MSAGGTSCRSTVGPSTGRDYRAPWNGTALRQSGHRLAPSRYRTPASLAKDQFTQNVSVSAVLCQFSQHMEVYPAQWQWPATVAVEQVV